MIAAAIRTSAWIALALALAASPAWADDDELLIDDLGVHDGMVVAVARLYPGFDAETRRSIDSGLPITVRYTTELWRKRRFWFDKQVDSRVRAFRVRYDPGEKLYSVSGVARRRRRETFESLDAALDRLSPRALAVYPFDGLDADDTYYVAIEMAIQPLTLEEARELEGWISGRIRSDDDEEPDGDAAPDGDDGGGISGAVFDFLLDLAGFGDKIHEAVTPRFRPPHLEELPRVP
jgi:hypothetical protein